MKVNCIECGHEQEVEKEKGWNCQECRAWNKFEVLEEEPKKGKKWLD